MERECFIETPIGVLRVVTEGECVTSIMLAEGSCVRELQPEDTLLQLVKDEIREYFAGRLCCFTFPVRMTGTPFQERVWEELRRIPYGTTVTYGEIATRIGCPKGSRAVGGACNSNRVLIAVPCHRVVGASGMLTGFVVGIERKEFLLRLENAF